MPELTSSILIQIKGAEFQDLATQFKQIRSFRFEDDVDFLAYPFDWVFQDQEIPFEADYIHTENGLLVLLSPVTSLADSILLDHYKTFAELLRTHLKGALQVYLMSNFYGDDLKNFEQVVAFYWEMGRKTKEERLSYYQEILQNPTRESLYLVRTNLVVHL